MSTLNEIAATVRNRRKDLGLSQAALAERAAVSRKWIYEFEAGKPTAELGLLLRVLDVLELELALVARRVPGSSDVKAALDEVLVRTRAHPRGSAADALARTQEQQRVSGRDGNE